MAQHKSRKPHRSPTTQRRGADRIRAGFFGPTDYADHQPTIIVVKKYAGISWHSFGQSERLIAPVSPVIGKFGRFTAEWHSNRCSSWRYRKFPVTQAENVRDILSSIEPRHAARLKDGFDFCEFYVTIACFGEIEPHTRELF
ncbi:hypothetical protein E1180_02300 [Roseibium denhamense]|uniref:hypothetical protein n=1 Tax=Roseibium denhamense TaxID=76305 RepID=UPI0012BD30BB|nr:hypothetical protein [Roseibium denhamense]MTI04346.1 hypothetical protein [Roseibium denhamense]